MSFFIRGKANGLNFARKEKTIKKKRLGKKKRGTEEVTDPAPKAKVARRDEDEEIPSDDEDDELPHQNGNAAADSESDDGSPETAQEKKLRLAKIYLEEIERQERERAEAKEIDRDAIGQRLKDDVLEQSGRLRRAVADQYTGYGEPIVLRCKDHGRPITALVISIDGQHMFTASKDCSIVKWCLKETRKLKSIDGGRKGTESKHKGHTTTVLSLAISSDNKFLASGDEGGYIHIWNPSTMEYIHTFKKHNAAVTGLAFRRGAHQLFSCSLDRSVKIWSLDEMAYIETLFGHQCGVTAIDALSRERAVTSGGRDNSLRIWKIVEESQLIYNGHTGSIDSVRLINEEHFLSSGDDGMLCLWGAMKKKPLSVMERAHGINSENGQPYWICSITTLLNTDLVASGSHDGEIRLWKCGDGFRSLTPVFSIPIKGFINAMSFTPSGSALIVGVGQEHRAGRWWRHKEARNSIVIVPLLQTVQKAAV